MTQETVEAPEVLKAPVPQEDTEAKAKAAARQAVNEMFAVTGWGHRDKIRFVIECPSGQTCLAQHLDTMALIDADLIEELDVFTRQLFPALDPSGMPQEDVAKVANESIWASLRDPDKKLRFFRLLNKLLEIAIVRPKVYNDGVELVDGKIVTGTSPKPLAKGEVNASDIDFADKMTIFGELNRPLEQLKPFRPESVVSLESVEPKQRVGSKT